VNQKGAQVAPFKRVLIANRGEIAGRIARAAAALEVESVGVFAPVDALSLHTRFATEAHEIPGSDPADPVAAYLDIDALIDIAIQSGCDAVHPGYGFLAENTGFAERCAGAGIAFVGPRPDTLALFGDKVRARAFAAELDIPVVPGSPESVQTIEAAVEAAGRIGYPIILKASAGGGGRGMRVVATADDLPEAFERCASEAAAAFGDGALFVEKMIERPRHIEVQILGDGSGEVIHLRERDCSIQLRHQKVIEVAPAPGLDPVLREQLLDAAVTMGRSANYLNAGTVEFLVAPESGEFWFIECNPRIQVEHTITEQVLGVDLVETQFRIAAGERLDAVGFAGQSAVGEPRGYSIQARVVGQGVGTISGYREPSGSGIRVDGNGYAGFVPPPQFDPLLAKVVCTGSRSADFMAVVDQTRRALGEFHIGGIPTNLLLLQQILELPEVRGGDARTSLLSEHPELGHADPGSIHKGPALALLEQQAIGLGAGAGGGGAAPIRLPGLPVGEDQLGIEAPMAGAIVSVDVSEGDEIAAGDTLAVISAMKMESVIVAPSKGTIAGVLPLSEGDSVGAGQVVMLLSPMEDAENADGKAYGEGTWGPTLEEVDTLKALARQRLAPGSEDPGVVRQRDRGKLTCRERIDLLLDSDSFREVGSIAGFASYDEYGEISAFTPANSVGGWGKVENRTIVVCADDFTSRGGHADGAIGAKSGYLDRLSMEMRVPSIRLLDGSSGGGSVAAMVPEQKQAGESSAKESKGAIKAGRPRVAGGGGSFLPGHLGSTMYAEQLATVPVVNMLLGSVVGIGAAKAVLGHFSVMVRDIAQLFVAGPPVVSHAMGYDITKEDLGGWHIHCRNGSVDNLAESEAEAMTMARRFLSYLPASVFEAPPVEAPDPADPPDRREEALFTLIPRKRTTTFDIRKGIRLMADLDSFFEVGPLWGTDQVTGFARFNGRPVGIIASDSQHANGGALTADGCDKLKRHLDLCDLFHLPIVNLIDNPGFAVGLEHELTGTIRKGGEWMVAFAQVKVPIFNVLMRRSFGVAGNNYATPRSRPSMRVVWPAADVGGIPPEGGIEAAYKRQLAEAEDPKALREELMARIESARGPVGPLNRFQIEEMIDPRDTRRYICDWVELAYQVVSQPGQLTSRPLQFRP
jgi:acetyl/propionyl-CoA carboxylase alpha subunit/acetyl-CoA carboxylase carboxyltransferase component